jgi:GNAT superfamily N-acetyltransferase
MIIRSIEAADREQWSRLWHDYLAFYETILPQSTYDATFVKLIGNDPAIKGLLAVQDGKPVGLVHYIFHSHCWKPEGVTYLQDLYNDPSVRGKGVGRKLIEAVYERADAAGHPSVYWLTQEFNYTGRMLYDRIGVKSPFIRYNRK